MTGPGDRGDGAHPDATRGAPADTAAASYPVNLVLTGRRCLVVGGGRVAAHKAEGLREAGGIVHVVGSAVGDAVRALDVTWEERPYRRGDAAGFRLVVAATNDPAVNRMVFEDGEELGIWVNSADDPAHCSFTLPAVARRGPVTVAVSTGGSSPALAGWLRSRLEGQLGPEYEVLAGVLAEERAMLREAGRVTGDLDWRGALDSDMLDLIRAGQVERARERLRKCLSSS